MRRKRIRTRRPSLLGLAALLFATGCGGGGDSAPPPSRPAIDATVAEQLASMSDSIADSLDQGDVCRAARLADDLNSQLSAAIAAGKVPRRYEDELQSRATELVNTVNCPSATPTTTEQDEVENGNGRGKKEGKEKKQDEAQDETVTEPTATVEIPTTEDQP